MAVALLLGSCQSAPEQPVPLERLRLPPGFKAELWALVPGASSLRVAETGAKVYVGTKDQQVFAVLDRERDGTADEVVLVASGLKAPDGIALDRDGALLVAEQHRVVRIAPSGLVREIVPAGVLPTDGRNGRRYARLGPDGRLYVSVAAPCDVCPVRHFEGTIVRMLPDGHELEIFARGVRSAGGFDWQPETGEMFFTDNGAPLTDGIAAPDELNQASEQGLHFGFPWRYGPRQTYPGFEGLPPGPVVHPVLTLEPHAGARGVEFYRGGMFPASYRHDALLALQGSGSGSDAAGYRIVRVRFEDGRLLRQDVFIDGWLGADNVAWGRPVDLASLPDGSLLISDDLAGAIYRITYALGRGAR